MKIVTYLAFTMLSIVMQFVVMDFIQEKEKVDNEISNADLNVTSHKKSLGVVFPQYTQKPEALYYRIPKERQVQKPPMSEKTYSNSSIEVTLETSTELSSTLFDFLYDENTSVTDDSSISATESLYTTTEFENVTEITLFGKNNSTTVKPKTMPKKSASKDCNCNLLYKVCDINCCCDDDCTNLERETFVCAENAFEKDQSNDFCYAQFSYSSYLMGSNLDHLLCVVKSNLPDKREILYDKHNPVVIDKTFKWHTSSKKKSAQELPNRLYRFGDPIWLIRNGTIHYVDLPSTVVNNYCNDRQPLHFLKNQNIKCNVKLMDLEIIRILNIIEETSVISMTEKSLNTSIRNCSTLHCTNWTIVLCDEAICTKYNKSLHDPLCTESICTYLARQVDYTFHYYNNKIMNATIKLFTEKVPLNVPFIEQEINVRFVIANESIDKIVEFSGNPGYITGLPVVISYSKGNYSENFFSRSSTVKYLSYPGNKNGVCTHSTGNNMLFGINKRIKCRYYHVQNTYHNETNTCKNIQRNITRFIDIKSEIAVSPFGNPYALKDEDWISIKVEMLDRGQYGKLNAQKTKLTCYNLITRFSFVFTFAAVGGKNKMLSARVDVTPFNVTFSTDDNMSAVITIDTTFIDETKPSVYEYAGGPQLNIHLPNDFFFPFPSNKTYTDVSNFYLIVLICIVNLICK